MTIFTACHSELDSESLLWIATSYDERSGWILNQVQNDSERLLIPLGIAGQARNDERATIGKIRLKTKLT